MLNSFVNTTLGSYLAGLIVLLLLLSLSFTLRQNEFNQVAGAQNLEATYHVLLTIKALKENPVSNHWYLPTITLGGDRNKGIPWGATVPRKSGDYIYTSFTPPGFLVPYLVISIFDAQTSIRNLARFNFAVGAIVSILLFTLLWRVLIFMGLSPSLSLGGALVGCAIGIFSREALQSHGIIYWSQSLYQLPLIAGLWFVFKYLSVDDNLPEKRRIYACAIVIAAFLGALTEWTGYIFNLGLVFLFWFGVHGVGSSKTLSIGILIVTAAAGACTLIHYGLALGYTQALDAFLGRFLARNASTGSISSLVKGYGLSFGLFLILFVVLAISHIATRRVTTPGDKPPHPSSLRQLPQHWKTYVSRYSSFLYSADRKHLALYFLFVAACIPLLENVLLLQHAEQFSFDRLKFIFPAALILAFSFYRQSNTLRFFLGAAILLASFQGYVSYKHDLNKYEKWAKIDAANQSLSIKISDNVDTSCAVYLSNIQVRGYANMLFNRGIYEAKLLSDSTELMSLRNSCAAVYLEGHLAFPDLPKYTKAVVTYPDGTIVELRAQNGEKQIEMDMTTLAIILLVLVPLGFFSLKLWKKFTSPQRY